MSSLAPLFQAHRTLTGQSVRVHLKDLTFQTGVLFCIDPENGNVALLTSTEDKANVAVAMIMGHRVERIEQHEDAATETLDEMLKIGGAEPHCDDGDATFEARAQRLEHLSRFLAQCSIPHEKQVQADEQIARADDDRSFNSRLSVFGGAATLSIGRDARPVVACANEQILQRLQTLLQRFEASSV